jgi:hypothetical protein
LCHIGVCSPWGTVATVPYNNYLAYGRGPAKIRAMLFPAPS